MSEGVEQMKSIKIGLLGLGNVGSGVWQIFSGNKDNITRYTDADVEIKKVLVRSLDKTRDVSIPKEVLTTDIEEILNDPEIKIVVELIGGIDTAFDYMKRAIEKGKHIVTANKAVIATYGTELLSLAGEKGVEVRFEGSVGGGIPIISTLTRNLAANQIDEIVGIINGTTNYILTKMTQEGMDFAEALKLAQENGYAEADPTSDVDGEDAAFKLAILAAISFGVRIDPNEIPREGIRRISEVEIQYAKQLGYTIKLLATAKKQNGNLEIHVHPALVSNNHPLASVSNEFNALFIRGNAVGELMLYGKGAGSLPTGSAVVGDILDVVKHIQHSVKSGNEVLANGRKFNVIGEGRGAYYVRLQVIDKPGVLGRITTTFGKHEISLASVVQQGIGESVVPLVFITHQVERSKLDEALDEIRNFDVVKEIASILRVETL